GSYIPASQRPDGTWRKARRVKEGYVPQEEVPLYESKGKQWANRKTLYPIGFSPMPVSPAENVNEGNSTNKFLTLFIFLAKKKKKKKKPGPSSGNEKQAQKSVAPSTTKAPEPTVVVEPAKKLKNLRKKLREIETLEQKIKSKELKNPEKDQLDKIARKPDILSEILALELTVK
ncbi:hypothetical protein AAG570_009544, partial [Ranatra chinensis]